MTLIRAPVLPLRPRLSVFSSIRSTHSTPTRTEIPSAIEWLPLPRSLAYRKALLLLSIPIPPSSWPSHLELASPLLATTSAYLKSKGIAVNAIYDGVGSSTAFESGGKERYKARLFFPDGHKVEYDNFNVDSISSDRLLEDLNYEPSSTGSRESIDQGLKSEGGSGIKEILICTHGSRDCRCSDRGGALVDALRGEVERRKISNEVRISEIAHVGGHKYAANAILLPSLDMMSNLTAEHAPTLISHLLSSGTEAGSMWAHWRGRYGFTEEQQAELWAKVDPASSKSSAQPQIQDSDQKSDVKEQKAMTAGSESVTLRFKTFEGEEKVVKASLRENLLEVGKRNELPSLEGVCGGNLECATCHLYLSESPVPPTGEASDEEWDMLGYALGYKEGESRLGCQVKVTKELGKWAEEGGIIGLPRF